MIDFKAKCKCGCGLDITPRLKAMLIHAQTFTNIPFKITSGARCKKDNKRVGGSRTSSHIKGVAVDIEAQGGYARLEIVKSLLMANFNRIGVYRNHIHADIDSDKPVSIYPGSYN